MVPVLYGLGVTALFLQMVCPVVALLPAPYTALLKASAPLRYPFLTGYQDSLVFYHALSLREFQFTYAWLTLGGWMALLFGHSLFLTFGFGRKFTAPSMWTTVAVDMVGCGALVWLQIYMELSHMPGALFLYLALLVFTSALYMSSIMLWRAFIAGLAAIMTYGLGQVFVQPLMRTEFLPLSHSLFFLLITVLIGSATGWQREYSARHQFLLSRLLEEAAQHDSLTGLLNHGAFIAHCERVWQQAIRERKRVGLIIADIDFFKRYNDRFGHLAGDQCIKLISEIFLHATGRGLDAAGRLGGEEFSILWYDVDPLKLTQMAERIRKRVASLTLSPHQAPETLSHVTVSVGALSILPEFGNKLHAALNLADKALYKAKAKGRDRVKLAKVTRATHNAST